MRTDPVWAQWLQRLKRFHRNVRYFYLAIAIHGFTFFGIYTLLLNLYLLRLGYGPEFIGLVNGIAPLILAAASLPAGAASRRWGSRRMMSWGFLVMATGFGLLPMSEMLPFSLRQTWIVTAYAISWLAAAFAIVNFGPYLMAWTGDQERSLAFAIQSATIPLAGFLGNLLGGALPGLFAAGIGVTLDSPMPYRSSLLVAAAIELLTLLALRQTAEAEVTSGAAEAAGSERTEPPYRLMILFALISIMYVAGEWTMRVYFNVYLDSTLAAPTSLIGVLSAGAMLLGLTAFLAPRAEARWGQRKLVPTMMLGGSAAFLPLIFVAHWLAVGLGYMLLVGVLSLMLPSYTVFSQSAVEPEWRTSISSAISMAIGLGIAIISLAGGSVIAAYGFKTLFIIGALLFLLAAGVFWWAFSLGPAQVGQELPESLL